MLAQLHLFSRSFKAFEGQGHTLTKNQFLNQLPKSVVNKEGSVIAVRDGVKNVFGGDGSRVAQKGGGKDVIFVNTPTQKLIAAGKAPSDIGTLKIKFDDGTTSLILKMKSTDTIGPCFVFFLPSPPAHCVAFIIRPGPQLCDLRES